jgi:hypothetical protein
MKHKLKILKIRSICAKLLLLLILSGCATQAEYIFYKTGVRGQFNERAIKYCHGDFEILEEEEFGPYTRVRIECME